MDCCIWVIKSEGDLFNFNRNKPTSSHSNFIKTIAISLPIATIPSIANAVIGIDYVGTNGYAYNSGSAVAEQVDTNTTWAYDYKNPGNKSYLWCE